MNTQFTNPNGHQTRVRSVDALRAARLNLNAAITDGDTHLTELRDLVEDELIRVLADRRREASR